MNATETPLSPPYAHLCEVGPPSPPSEPGTLAVPVVTLPRRPKIHVVYVAGPFRAPTPIEVRANVLRAEQLGCAVLQLGAMPLIPHANTGHFDSVAPQDLMIEGTLELMRRCDAVVFTDDWQRSVGARGENEEAVRLGLPRFFSIDGLRAWLEARR